MMVGVRLLRGHRERDRSLWVLFIDFVFLCFCVGSDVFDGVLTDLCFVPDVFYYTIWCSCLRLFYFFSL